MKLKVPFYKQETDYTCAAACIKMLLENIGIIYSEKELALELKTDPSTGVKNFHIIEFIEKIGLKCQFSTNSKIIHITDLLNKKIPVMVNWVEPQDDDGHFSIITGLTDTSLILNDPWHGQDFEIDIQEFENRWFDSSKTINRWMFFIE